MKKRLFAPIIGIFCALMLCLVLLVGIGCLKDTLFQSDSHAAKADRQLITVWIRSDTLSPSSWLRAQAAAYQKAHPGVNIWLRTVTSADMQLLSQNFDEAAPDILLFSAGESISPTWFEDLDSLPALGSKAKSGLHDQRQLAAPLCMAGYALVQQTQDAPVTPAPTSLFGVTPTPQPSTTAAPVTRESWPATLAADDQLGAGLLSLIQAPIGARLMDSQSLQTAFLRGDVPCALLNTMQARALQAQGKGMTLLCAAPATDLVLFGGVMQQSQPAAKNFLSYLICEPAQQALGSHGLFSVRKDIHLYGANTPILQAVESALADGWLPNAFSWPDLRDSTILTAQALYTKGESVISLFVP